MEGKMTLVPQDQEPRDLEPGDAFVIPPGMVTQYANCSDDLELLEATLGGEFTTTIAR
tara:strand:- start:89 stop:262 length:174 start_codon:yes stop_codon:yes gene_type:complete